MSIEKVKGYRLGRELVALRGGPFGQHWYWKDEFEQHLVTAQIAKDRGLPPAAWSKLGYKETQEIVPNHDKDLPGVTGTVWRWVG